MSRGNAMCGIHLREPFIIKRRGYSNLHCYLHCLYSKAKEDAKIHTIVLSNTSGLSNYFTFGIILDFLFTEVRCLQFCNDFQSCKKV